MRIVTHVLLVVMIAILPWRVLAADLAADISSRAKAAAAQARPNAKGQDDENPYFLPGVILMSAGGVITLVGLTHETGAKCTSTLATIECGTTKSKATIFTGLGAVGVGAFLFNKGRVKHSPAILFGPGAFGVREQLTW